MNKLLCARKVLICMCADVCVLCLHAYTCVTKHPPPDYHWYE